MQQVVKAVDEQGLQQGSKEHLQMHVSCPHSSRHPRHQLSWKQRRPAAALVLNVQRRRSKPTAGDPRNVHVVQREGTTAS